MSRTGRDADVDELIRQITDEAHGDDEQLWAFRQAFEDHVTLPADGLVVGEPVSVTQIDYQGNARRGLVARCRRADGSEHVVAASDVAFAEGSAGARHVAAYRKWLGLEPYPLPPGVTTRRKREHKATADDLDLSTPIELIALSITERAARCRLLGSMGSNRAITLRASRLWDVVPGEIVTVTPRKQWSYAGHPYLSGEIESVRLDVRALGLVPLRLEERGAWDPREEYWSEEGEPPEDWAKPIIARGPRPAFEMEQVLPGQDPDDPFADPITESNDFEGRRRGRRSVQDTHGPLPGGPALSRRPRSSRQLRLRPPPRGRHPSLRGGRPHRGAVSRRRLPGRARMGLDRQPPVSALSARVRAVSLAARPLRRGRARLHEDAVAQPVRQPGRAVRRRARQSAGDMESGSGSTVKKREGRT
jgi:hypothetical protein